LAIIRYLFGYFTRNSHSLTAPHQLHVHFGRTAMPRLWPLRFGCRQGHLQHSFGWAAAPPAPLQPRGSDPPAAPAPPRSLALSSPASAQARAGRFALVVDFGDPPAKFQLGHRAASTPPPRSASTVAPPARSGARHPRRPRGRKSERLHAPEAPQTPQNRPCRRRASIAPHRAREHRATTPHRPGPRRRASADRHRLLGASPGSHRFPK
jgi:hypothetical protein